MIDVSLCDLRAQAPAALLLRPAHRTDSREIARLMCMAGGGLFEFLFDDFIPFLTAMDFLTIGVATDLYPISYRNCHVAAHPRDRSLAGIANAFPADLLKHDGYGRLAADRRDHIQPMLEVQDWGSMFLNALAVDSAYRGHGTGARLLAWAEDRAREEGYVRLSLHVWADNTDALAFYRARGFVVVGNAAVAEHPRLRHRGGSVLMSKRVAPS
jgi:GNAT superfamily N-acetyltransferase